jgi:hypothetical protein
MANNPEPTLVATRLPRPRIQTASLLIKAIRKTTRARPMTAPTLTQARPIRLAQVAQRRRVQAAKAVVADAVGCHARAQAAPVARSLARAEMAVDAAQADAAAKRAKAAKAALVAKRVTPTVGRVAHVATAAVAVRAVVVRAQLAAAARVATKKKPAAAASPELS